MTTRSHLWIVPLFLLGLAACVEEEGARDSGAADAGMDAGWDADLPEHVQFSPDGEGFCCAPDSIYDDCPFLGAFIEDPSECRELRWDGVCDWPACGYMHVDDEHGCDVIDESDAGLDCLCPAGHDGVRCLDPDGGPGDSGVVRDGGGLDVDAGVDGG